METPGPIQGVGDLAHRTRLQGHALSSPEKCLAHGGIERYAKRGHPWPCGMNGETPNLMLGLAGIGYFYLRLAIPAIPSILLLRREAFAQCGVPPRSGLVGSTHLVGSPRIDRSLG